MLHIVRPRIVIDRLPHSQGYVVPIFALLFENDIIATNDLKKAN